MTDSIAAVEAAWTAKALELGLEPEIVIAATHGRRASDNLMELVPGMKKEHVDGEVDRKSFNPYIIHPADRSVQGFERSILAFADTPPHSRKSSFASLRTSSPSASGSSQSSFGPLTPLTSVSDGPRRPSSYLSNNIALAFSKFKMDEGNEKVVIPQESPFEEDPEELSDPEEVDEIVDMSVRILPGVRELIKSLPTGKYAVATSGAKTYCHGCLTRTGYV